MKKKTLLVCLLITAMLVSLVGCGSGSGGGSEEDVKVAILIPSSPTDGGFGQAGADGLKYVAEELGIEPVIIEAATADLMKTEAEALAADGFNVIFGHGGQYASPFDEISDDYPDTLFITAGGNVIKDNQMPMGFTLEQLTYIQGVMAGKLTKTNKIGAVIGGEFPAYQKTSRGFELGAKSVNPDVEVLLGVTQDASDMNEGYELTMSQIQAGADIVFSNANQATQGSVNAAKETDTYIFGAVSDIQNEAPDQVISSAFQSFGPAMLSVVKNYLAGNLEPGIIDIGVPEGGIGWAWNEKVKAEIPEDVVALYDEVLEQILSGEIHVPNEQEGW
jgi:basic membrane protein A